MKSILIVCLFLSAKSFGQVMSITSEPTTGFIYVEGIQWRENSKQDSVTDIIIEGDTMAAIRSLLIYCLQEKSENDNAGGLLSTLNLDYLQRLLKSKEFNYFHKEYKAALSKNKRARNKAFPQYKR